MQDGLCRKEPSPHPVTEKERWNLWWFPQSKRKMALEARQTCAACPVLTQCDQYIKHRERGMPLMFREGNWAGTTPHERLLAVRVQVGPRRGRVGVR